MPIWKLSPIDPTDRNWKASTHQGPAVVRAPDEETARSAASLAFAIATSHTPGEEIRYTPWRHRWLVSAECVDAEAEGDVEIIDPPHHNDDLRKVNWRSGAK